VKVDLSPGDEMRLAAVALRHLVDAYRAEANTNPYWDLGYAAGVTNAMGGGGGELAAAFTPEAAEALAVWLDDHANEHSSYDCQWGSRCPALRLAYDINGHPAEAYAWPEWATVTQADGTWRLTMDGHVRGLRVQGHATGELRELHGLVTTIESWPGDGHG
jgi:hypothetical protein